MAMFQANSNKMREIEKAFNQQVSALEAAINDMKQKFDPLVNGGWKGRGAERFFDTFQNDIIPGLTKVKDYMKQSADTGGQTANTIEEAIRYIHSKCKEFEGIAGL
jgi:WXG100 family type VII secretion target